MRKRLAFLWTPLVLGLALMLPASTAATSYGQITFVGGYCTGNNTVHATFKVHKNSGFYATKLTITAKGQGYHNGHWVNEYNIGTASKIVNTSSQANMTRDVFYAPGHAGKHRIAATGKIWNGGTVLAKGSVRSGFCI